MEKKKFSSTKTESKLFALVNSILELNKKHKEGKISLNFFHKAIKTAMDDLIVIRLTLKGDDTVSLSDLIEKMKIQQAYNKAMNILNKITSLDQEDPAIDKKTPSILELPGLISEITSSFITLMDALKIDGIKDKDFIFNLFEDLMNLIKEVPFFEGISKKIREINHHVKNHPNALVSNRKYREKLVDHLYDVFNEFQEKMK